MSRSSKQIEFGQGHTWTFDASETITSGIIVHLCDVGPPGAVKLCHYSESAIGVSLMPASINKWASVMLDGVVQLLITGADGTAGYFIKATAGNAFPFDPSSLTKPSLACGILLESAENGVRKLVKLNL